MPCDIEWKQDQDWQSPEITECYPHTLLDESVCCCGRTKTIRIFCFVTPSGCVAYCVRSSYTAGKKRKIVRIRCASMLFVVVFIFICVDDDQSRISVPSPSVKMWCRKYLPSACSTAALRSFSYFCVSLLCVPCNAFRQQFPSTQIFPVKGVSKKEKKKNSLYSTFVTGRRGLF